MLIGPEAVEELKDPVESAHVVGLRYVTDGTRGIERQRNGSGFRYRNTAGRIVRDAATLRRIKALAVPPAWTAVWICPDPNGHLQATGRDDRGRKQFRYHPRWREIRDETKYARMINFASALPRIRRRINQDLALSGLPRNKVLAAVLRLLEVSFIRVGNDEYARANDSFGLTTMRDKHVDVRGAKLRFHFRGKGGKCHDVGVQDRRLARIVKRCQELPGQELFQFVDDEGQRQDVRSGDVNDYLREASGEDFTAKDFRTWAGTVLTTMALRGCETVETEAEARKNIATAIESTAEKLGNTPAICRKCYVHPHVLDSYLDGTLAGILKKRIKANGSPDILRGDEAAVLRLLRHRLTMEEKLAKSIAKEKAGRSRRSNRKAFHSPGGPRR